MKNTEKIPQRIFYVWGYGERKSQIANICIENWRMMLPDFDIIEVNEKLRSGLILIMNITIIFGLKQFMTLRCGLMCQII